MNTTKEKIPMENTNETFTQKRFIFSFKEIMGALSLLTVLTGLWTANQIKFKDIELKFKEVEMRMDQNEKNNLQQTLKFDKIDQKLDGIQKDVMDIKLNAPAKQ